MKELGDFFTAKNGGQSADFFRIRSVGQAPGAAKCFDVEKAQRGQVLSYGICRQLAFVEQFGLIFANVSRAQTIWRAVKSSGKIFDCTNVVAYGILSVITKLEFLQHQFSEMGHRDTSCDPHLYPSHQATSALYTSREASAAGRLRPNGVSGHPGKTRRLGACITVPSPNSKRGFAEWIARLK